MAPFKRHLRSLWLEEEISSDSEEDVDLITVPAEQKRLTMIHLGSEAVECLVEVGCKRCPRGCQIRLRLLLTVVTRGVMDALDAAGVKVRTVSHSVPDLAYPYGSDAKPVVMTRSVKFNCVTLDTTCGPLVLRGLKAWVDDASTATELIVSRPVMELLGFRVEDLLVGARKKKEEWDVSSVPTNELSGMANVKRLMAEKLNPPDLDPDDGMECATPEVYPKASAEDEAERHRTKQGAVQAILTAR
ncbi:hypothetical protein DYB26_014610 [Aphanomyces astaci]|uniref:Uncharacterized protein n=1 Tax=Aphanomyces astaci TaxID=112090 RepID=A0A3R7AUT3_APHAT|nr:hypothetical protein DYB26_014610 [Aphanomyces astaci]